jgi:hypothetical protein
MTLPVPDIRPLRILKTGVMVVMLPSGSIGEGGSSTTGSTTLKLDAADHGPVLAPS